MTDKLKTKVLEICKNLTRSIKSAKKRHTLKGLSGLSTNPSATASGLQNKLDQIMTENNLSKKDLI